MTHVRPMTRGYPAPASDSAETLRMIAAALGLLNALLDTLDMIAGVLGKE